MRERQAFLENNVSSRMPFTQLISFHFLNVQQYTHLPVDSCPLIIFNVMDAHKRFNDPHKNAKRPSEMRSLLE